MRRVEFTSELIVIAIVDPHALRIRRINISICKNNVPRISRLYLRYYAIMFIKLSNTFETIVKWKTDWEKIKQSLTLETHITYVKVCKLILL